MKKTHGNEWLLPNPLSILVAAIDRNHYGVMSKLNLHHQAQNYSSRSSGIAGLSDLIWASLLALAVLAGLAAGPVEAAPRADGPTVGQIDLVARART